MIKIFSLSLVRCIAMGLQRTFFLAVIVSVSVDVAQTQ